MVVRAYIIPLTVIETTITVINKSEVNHVPQKRVRFVITNICKIST